MRRMSHWALTKPASLCQSNPKVPQLCSIENVFDVASPKYHFHDDTRELAELEAFRRQFTMVTIGFCWIQDGNGNFITSKPKRVLLTFVCFVRFTPTLNYGMAQTTKEEKSRFIREKALLDPSLKPVSLLCCKRRSPSHIPQAVTMQRGSTTPPPQVAH